MRRINDNDNFKVVTLASKIKYGVDSCLNDYGFLYKNEELYLLRKSSILLRNGIFKGELLDNLLRLEEELKFFTYRCFEYENSKGLKYVSWLKDDKYKKNSKIVLATFGDPLETCSDSTIGVNYKVSRMGLIGADKKNMAAIVERKDPSINTIATLDDGSVVNSYNLGTAVVTPKQIGSNNEVILDRNYIEVSSIICTNSDSLDSANNLARKLNVKVEKCYNNQIER